MKTCFKCNQEKPITEFYKHKMMADGHLNKCKDCTKKDVFDHRHGKGREKILAYDRERAKTEKRKEKAFIKSIEWKEKYPHRRAAQIYLGNAVRSGRITPWPVCALPECNAKPEAHHPDYSRYLDVVWLCPSHHRQAHAIAKKELKMP